MTTTLMREHQDNDMAKMTPLSETPLGGKDDSEISEISDKNPKIPSEVLMFSIDDDEDVEKERIKVRFRDTTDGINLLPHDNSEYDSESDQDGLEPEEYLCMDLANHLPPDILKKTLTMLSRRRDRAVYYSANSKPNSKQTTSTTNEMSSSSNGVSPSDSAEDAGSNGLTSTADTGSNSVSVTEDDIGSVPDDGRRNSALKKKSKQKQSLIMETTALRTVGTNTQLIQKTNVGVSTRTSYAAVLGNVSIGINTTAASDPPKVPYLQNMPLGNVTPKQTPRGNFCPLPVQAVLLEKKSTRSFSTQVEESDLQLINGTKSNNKKELKNELEIETKKEEMETKKLQVDEDGFIIVSGNNPNLVNGNSSSEALTFIQHSSFTRKLPPVTVRPHGFNNKMQGLLEDLDEEVSSNISEDENPVTTASGSSSTSSCSSSSSSSATTGEILLTKSKTSSSKNKKKNKSMKTPRVVGSMTTPRIGPTEIGIEKRILQKVKVKSVFIPPVATEQVVVEKIPLDKKDGWKGDKPMRRGSKDKVKTVLKTPRIQGHTSSVTSSKTSQGEGTPVSGVKEVGFTSTDSDNSINIVFLNLMKLLSGNEKVYTCQSEIQSVVKVIKFITAITAVILAYSVGITIAFIIGR